MATPLGVEIFTVVTGPLRLLEDTPQPIAAGSYEDDAAKFQAEIEAGILAFLKADKPKPNGDPPPDHDYQDVNKRVSKAAAQLGAGTSLGPRLAVTAQLPDPMLGVQYNQQFDRTVKFLHGTLPRRTYTTLAGGIQNVEPPSLELSPFWRAYEAILDPRVLLRDLGEHILVSDQTEVTRQNYPQIYALMTGAMLKGMADRKTADLDWEPTLRQAQQIETLLLVSRLDPELAAELQERARQAEQAQRSEEQQQSGPGGADPGDKAATDYQTSTQRVSYR
jgi:hypothetical protein